MDKSALPHLSPGRHKRTLSRSPTRSPTRQRFTDDILSDLSPATTFEAFTNPSGKLKASIEAATPSERAFGIRATLASKKIQEWVHELSGWPWPNGGGSEGFEMPNANRRKAPGDLDPILDNDHTNPEFEYLGSLLADDVDTYELRIEEIQEDMDDLNVEEIKSTVLNTHFSAKSRPSSSASLSSNSPLMPALLSSYTKMDDFTAVVTATVLQALPNLSKLMRLMDVWSIRLSVLRKVPPLLELLDDVEIALKSGWKAIETTAKLPIKDRHNNIGEQFLSRETFRVIRDVLQDKVTTLGQDLDYMLDTLEGRKDTLPDQWLDKMEALERDYGEWVVSGERMVREGEWDRMARARKAEEHIRQAEEDANRAAETARREEEQRSRLQEEARVQEEYVRREAERLREENERRLRLVEEARLQQEARMQEEYIRREAERLREENERRLRLEEEARLQQEARMQEEYARQEAERVRHERDQLRLEEMEKLQAAEAEKEAVRLEEEKVAEAALLLAEKTREEASIIQEAEVAGAALLTRLAEEAQAEQKKLLELQREKSVEPPEVSDIVRGTEEPLVVEGKDAWKQEHPTQATQLEAVDILPPAAPQTGKDVEPVAQSENQATLGDAENKTPTTHRDPCSYVVPKPTGIFNNGSSILDSPPTTPTKAAAGPILLSATYSEKNGSPPNSKTPKPLDATLPPASIISPFHNRQGSRSGSPESPIAPNTPSRILKPQKQDMLRSKELHADELQPTKQGETPIINPQDDPPTPPLAPTEISSSGSPSSGSADGEFTEDGKPLQNNHKQASIAHDSTDTSDFTPLLSKLDTHDGDSSALQQTPTPPSAHSALPTESLARKCSAQCDPTQSTTADGEGAQDTSTGNKPADEEWTIIDPSEPEYSESNSHEDQEEQPQDFGEFSLTSGPSSRGSLRLPHVFDHAPPDPSHEILEANLADHSHPASSPTNSTTYSTGEGSEPTTPSRSPRRETGKASFAFPSLETGKSAPELEALPTLPTHQRPLIDGLFPVLFNDGAKDAPLPEPEHSNSTQSPAVTNAESNPINRIEILRRGSDSSSTSTVNIHPLASSPVLSSPISIDDISDLFEESPTTGRVGHQPAHDYTPPGSPPMPPMLAGLALAPSRPAISSDSLTLEPETPGFGLSISSGVGAKLNRPPSPKKNAPGSTDDQLQTQISNLLESIPARIRLTSEPPNGPNLTSHNPHSETLRLPKNRPSFSTSSVRSHSSLSMRSRASTPSFTLTPAYGKGPSRPRPHSNNPEIKLYHLSRSGEAPIKLFVRLVGESGERVMVRVGGGWADLGEYLKEYASHHGRRSGGKEDKVEIQDMGSRNVSGASMVSSSSTVRGSGRASPAPRPSSVLERERPMSSLYIRKTRKSDADSTATSTVNLRSPSTPLTFNSKTAGSVETPPSGASSSGRRSPSRLGATEDFAGSLGLAGPKSKNVKISERDAEWVESMKEKVRLASTEKEWRQRDREDRDGRRDRGSFGDVDRVGGTKRLFKKV